MEYKVEMIQTLISITILLIIKYIINKSIKKATSKNNFSLIRKVLIIKIINIILSIIGIITLSIVWGVDKNDFILFFSSLLTILGVALFAQWSIFSNITAGVILFFNNPVNLHSTKNLIFH